MMEMESWEVVDMVSSVLRVSPLRGWSGEHPRRVSCRNWVMLGVFQLWGSQEPPRLVGLESAFQNPSVTVGGPSMRLGSWSSVPPSPRLAPPLPGVPLGLGPAQAPERRSSAFGISDLMPAPALPLPCQGDLGSCVGSQGGGQHPHPRCGGDGGRICELRSEGNLPQVPGPLELSANIW